MWLTFDAVLPGDAPVSLEFLVESSANTPGLGQTVEMFNWNTNQFDELESVSTSFNVDSVQSIDITTAISDYVQGGTGAVGSRVGYRVTGFLILFPWTVNVDQAAWLVD